MASSKSLQQAIANIKIWHKGEQRAPHKPLLLLYVFRDISQVGFNSYRLIGEVLYLIWKRLFKSIEIEVQQRFRVKQNVPIIILSSGSQQACNETIDFLFDNVGGMGQQGYECTFFQRFPEKGIISGNNEFQTSSEPPRESWRLNFLRKR